MPVGGYGVVRVRDIVRESATRGAKPVSDSAIHIPPKNVVAPIAIEITNAVHLPIKRDGMLGIHGVARVTTATIPQPIGHSSVDIAPQNVVTTVTIEIASPSDLPV